MNENDECLGCMHNGNIYAIDICEQCSNFYRNLYSEDGASVLPEDEKSIIVQSEVQENEEDEDF